MHWTSQEDNNEITIILLNYSSPWGHSTLKNRVWAFLIKHRFLEAGFDLSISIFLFVAVLSSAQLNVNECLLLLLYSNAL